VPQGDEVSVLGEPVNDHQDDGLAVDARESFHEVHGHVGPDDGWHVEGLKKTRRVEILRLVVLTCCTHPYVVLDHHLRTGNMKVEVQPLQRLGHPLMAGTVHSIKDAR
jgi:hypothetical protein